jgi:hypothetical protein
MLLLPTFMENILFMYISVHTEAQTLFYDKLDHIPRELMVAE